MTFEPAHFATQLLDVAPHDRDHWVNQALGLDELPDDGADLPRDCTPYLPSSVAAVLHTIERAAITRDDVFVDVGSGAGRALALVHLLTGADAIGIEIQAAMVARARALATRLRLDRVATVHGDAADLLGDLGRGTVFYFYAPFGGDRLRRAVDALEPLARVRPLRLCFVDMPPPDLTWLTELPSPHAFEPVTVCTTRLP